MSASGLVANTATAVHVNGLSANPSFVNFNCSATTADLGLRLEAGDVPQSNANPMQHEPRGLLSDADGTCNFVAADAVLAVTEHPDDNKPLLQRDGRILENGSHFGTELAVLVGALALPFPLIVEEGHVVTSTSGAG